MKPAFTFLELVFVIVVLGILSIGGSDIFLRIYESYFENRTYNDMQAKTQLALDQIANRLTHRIKSSVIVGQSGGYSSLESSDGADLAANTAYTLEWISSDFDSQRGIATLGSNYTPPGWSGFIDLDNSDGTALVTPGGNLTAVDNIITSLSYGNADLNATTTTTTNNVVMLFPDAAGHVGQYGWYGDTDINLTKPIRRQNDSTLAPVSFNFTGVDNEVFEQYKLAFSAYALEYDPNTRNITLFYNYRPWNDQNYTQGISTVFLEDVSHFVFKSIGSMIKIQLCVNRADHQVIATGDKFSICKERSIF